MMKEIKITNLVKFYTILLLEKSRHGYEIIKTVSESLGKKVSPGEIYPFLKMLRRHGYIGVRKVGGREKKVYSLTIKGKKFLYRILDSFGGLIDAAVRKKLTKCIHCGCEIYRGGCKKVIGGKKLVFCCPNCAKSFK